MSRVGAGVAAFVMAVSLLQATEFAEAQATSSSTPTTPAAT